MIKGGARILEHTCSGSVLGMEKQGGGWWRSLHPRMEEGSIHAPMLLDPELAQLAGWPYVLPPGEPRWAFKGTEGHGAHLKGGKQQLKQGKTGPYTVSRPAEVDPNAWAQHSLFPGFPLG